MDSLPAPPIAAHSPTPGGSVAALPGWVYAPEGEPLDWPAALPRAVVVLRVVEGKRTRSSRHLVIPAWVYTGLEILAGEPNGSPLDLSVQGDPILHCAAEVALAYGGRRLAALYALGGYRALIPLFCGHTGCREAGDPCTVQA